MPLALIALAAGPGVFALTLSDAGYTPRLVRLLGLFSIGAILVAAFLIIPRLI